MDALHGANNLLSGTALQEIAVNTELQHRSHVAVAVGGGQYHDADARMVARNRRGRRGTVIRQLKVEQQHIRHELPSNIDGIDSRAAVGHDLDARRSCQQFRDALAEQGVIVDNGCSDRIRHAFIVSDNYGPPRKGIERRQASKTCTPARSKSRFEEAIDRWLAANRRTIPDAVFGFPAKQCAAVACSGNPSRLTRPRDEIDLPVAGSAGDDALDHQAELARRTNTPASVQLEVGQKDTENNNLRHHLCVIYLTETCC